MPSIAERSIETDTALAKLARALDVPQDDLILLEHLDIAHLRDLHWKVNDVLGAANRKRLQGVIAASKLVPTGLAATIGEKWFGPVLCAQLVGLVDPVRGGQYARHLSVDFMADITARTDPRVVGELIHELRLDSMQAIAGTLLERSDHLTLSHFVGHLPADVVASILDAIEDNAAVVRIARYVDDLGHLDPVVALLPDERIIGLVGAVDEQDLWVDGLHLFSQLGDPQVARIATTIVQTDDAMITSALGAFERHDLWEQGLALVSHLDTADLTRFTDVLLVVDEAMVHCAVRAIDRHGAWDTLVRIAVGAGDLGHAVRRRLTKLVAELPTASIDAFRAEAARHGHPHLLEQILEAS